MKSFFLNILHLFHEISLRFFLSSFLSLRFLIFFLVRETQTGILQSLFYKYTIFLFIFYFPFYTFLGLLLLTFIFAHIHWPVLTEIVHSRINKTNGECSLRELNVFFVSNFRACFSCLGQRLVGYIFDQQLKSTKKDD